MSDHHAKAPPEAATDSRPRRRLFVTETLVERAEIIPPREVSHRLLSVLRLPPGEVVALFNGRDGEWAAVLELAGKRDVRLAVSHRLKRQPVEPELQLCFAPIKQPRIDWLVEKATELGATRLTPVITRRTQMQKLRPERLEAIAIEAAEQCERLSVPRIEPAVALERLLAAWPDDRPLLFCDERGEAPLLALVAPPAPLAMLVGPEGGFAPEETAALRARAGVLPVSLGPRILRAETAALAALSMWLGAGR